MASGSKGNAISIRHNNKQFLVDVGIGFQTLKKKLLEAKIDSSTIEAVLLTHEHQDHTRGLKTFLKSNPETCIYLTKGTYESLTTDVKEEMINYRFVKSEQVFSFLDLKATPFMLSHDAKEPVGYVIENATKKVVIATDTGYIDEAFYELLSNADLYVLEANHNPELLMKSSRPFVLKKRILGETGHLSNQDACLLINTFIKMKENSIWVVAHISEDCNTVLDIEKTIVSILDDPTKIEVKYASQTTLELIKL